MMGASDGGPVYGLNVRRWEEAHPGWKVYGRGSAEGFKAHRLDSRHRAAGKPVVAATLDELAVLAEAAEAQS